MLALELLSWWYGPGWALVKRRASSRVIKVSHVFSLPILARTMFAPWRRIVTYPGAGLDARLKALGDNLFSRIIGFTIRLGVLVIAGLLVMATVVGGLLSLVLWPLIPLTIPSLIVAGFVV